MKKYKHFLALGASTLALSLAQTGYATENISQSSLNDQNVLNVSNDNNFNHQINNSISVIDSSLTSNVDFMKNNPNYEPEKKDIVNQENEIKTQMQATVFQAVKAGFIKFHELPTSYKIHVVQGFSSITEDSHYDSTDNSLQLSFMPKDEIVKLKPETKIKANDWDNLPDDVKEAVKESEYEDNTNSEFHSKGLYNEFSAAFENDKMLAEKVGVFNSKLVNQFVFLHELAHAVNHHFDGEKASGNIYAYQKTTDKLSPDEVNAFSAYTSDTLDENFADAYGGIMFLKLNNFSDESIHTLKQIAFMRDYNAKNVNNNFYNDSVEAHFSYYTLQNVLDNIDKIKNTQDQKDLINLARDFSSNGTYQAYQNYGKSHNNSLSEEKQRDIAELATQYLYNEVNKDKPNFAPLQIDKAKYGNTYYSDLTNLDKEAIQNWSHQEVKKFNSLFDTSNIAKALDLSHVKAEDVTKTLNFIKEISPTQDPEQLQRMKDSAPYVYLKSKILIKNHFDKTNMPTIYQNIISDILKYENQKLSNDAQKNEIKEALPSINNVSNSNISSAVSTKTTMIAINNNNEYKPTYNAAQLLPILDNLDKELSNKTVSNYVATNTNSNIANKIKSLREKINVETQNNPENAINTTPNETPSASTSSINGAQNSTSLNVNLKAKREKLGFTNTNQEEKTKENIAQTLRASFVN